GSPFYRRTTLRLLRRLLGLEPGHHLAEALAGDLDGVVEVRLVKSVEVLHPPLVLGAPLLGELAAGDLGEDLLHFLLGLVVDDSRTPRQVAIFRRITDRIAH